MAKREIERTGYGKRLYDSRKAKGLTQEQAAKLIGISQSTLTELERTGLGSNKTNSMARVYGVDAHWLETGQPLPPGVREPSPLYMVAPPSESEWAHLVAIRDMSEEDRHFIEEEAALRHQRYVKLRREILASIGINGEADNASVEKALGNVPKSSSASAAPAPARPSLHGRSHQGGRSKLGGLEELPDTKGTGKKR